MADLSFTPGNANRADLESHISPTMTNEARIELYASHCHHSPVTREPRGICLVLRLKICLLARIKSGQQRNQLPAVCTEPVYISDVLSKGCRTPRSQVSA